jgi:phospholipase C
MHSGIKHVFVLMLENRSFDHMLGYSNITGINAITQLPTQIDGLINKPHTNTYKGDTYSTTPNADFILNVDPPHEFMDVFKQICGEDVIYDRKVQYDIPKKMSGFVWDYVNSSSEGEGGATSDFAAIMKCYDTKVQLPIMYSLAKEFVVCDRWFASMPGPTWPNRLFSQGGSSMGLDDSPSNYEMLKWDTIDGIVFKNGSIYDALDKKGIPWKIYGGAKYPLEGSIPLVAALKGITLDKWSYFDSFGNDVKDNYKPFYTFIEPNYGNIINGTYSGGQSQHPKDNVLNGEKLIKDVYEAIRNSSVWESSVLIITYDEHGGFADHVIPPKTVAPGDSLKYSTHGFDFTQLGVRVPALIISPLIKQNVIDHTVYDHTSILATIERLVDIPPLTQRDAHANDLLHLFELKEPRECPVKLPHMSPFLLTGIKEEVKENVLLPAKGNVHGLKFIHEKIGQELGLQLETSNTTSDVSDNSVVITAEIEKAKTST